MLGYIRGFSSYQKDMGTILSSYRTETPNMQLCLKNERKKENESRSIVSDSLRSHGLYSPWNSPGQNTGVGSLSLLQGIFPTQGSNPGLPHCRHILYQLSHQGSKNTGVGSLSFLQQVFSNLESNRSLRHCRWILYQLS